MFRNYLITAWRNFIKNGTFSLINVLGLTIGITVCMMIFLFVMNEFSVDRFHEDGKNIYRVMRGFEKDALGTPYLSGPYAPALRNDFPSEIREAIRVMPSRNLFVLGDRSYNEQEVYLADSTFFTFFSFPLLRGNASSALKNPNSVVLTETTAKKYFGSVDNAMGKLLEMDKQLHLKVTGVARDVPSNSHLNFDLVVPIENVTQNEGFKMWMNNGLFVYLLLNPETDVAALEKKFEPFMKKYLEDDMRTYGFDFTLSLTPLKDVYFEHSSFDNVKHGEKKVVYIFLSIAVLILVIACINFMNLSTIRAVDRSKEVGLRKVMGALRSGLIRQFIGESILLATIASFLSMVLLMLVMPLYNEVLGFNLTVSWNRWPIYAFLIGVTAIVGILAGSYPALVLSGFSPVQALKGKLRFGKGGLTFRQALVIVQFTISVFLITGTIVMVNQMRFVRNSQLGYHQDQSVLVRLDNNDIRRNSVLFKNQLQREKNIFAVSLMSGEPGGFYDQFNFDVEGRSQLWTARTEFADFECVKTLGLKIIAGRDFSSQFPTDSADAALINHTAAQQLGWTPEQAIGKWVKNKFRDEKPRRIVGVVEDYNFLSLKQSMEALVIAPNNDRRVVVIRLKPGNVQAGIAAIRNEYARVAPAYPFEYRFLDQQFDELYRNDLRQQTILTIFAALAIFVACLGLFGLASFAAAKRFKEIGIRKTLGSSVRGIVILLSKDLLKPVLVATCIALPLAYYAMNKWLENFAYKTQLSWWIFILAAVIAIVIALLTVSARAIKAAIVSPATSLRSE
ncbi:MAG: ABC transporter permease [Chitinophagaceae bacterium]|nr:ABC transporter permease [Chitinophagaceae bacterium]